MPDSEFTQQNEQRLEKHLAQWLWNATDHDGGLDYRDIALAASRVIAILARANGSGTLELSRVNHNVALSLCKSFGNEPSFPGVKKGCPYRVNDYLDLAQEVIAVHDDFIDQMLGKE